MSHLPGGTSGSGAQPVGGWPGTWGPAGARGGRHRGQQRGRGCRSARRLAASGPLGTPKQGRWAESVGGATPRHGGSPSRCLSSQATRMRVMGVAIKSQQHGGQERQGEPWGRWRWLEAKVRPWDSPSRAGITVFRRASTRPSGEPNRKKPETLKSRRAVLVGPSGTSAPAGQETVLGRLGSPEAGAACRLWVRVGNGALRLAVSRVQLAHPPGNRGEGKFTCSERLRAPWWAWCAGQSGWRALGWPARRPAPLLPHLPVGPVWGPPLGTAAHCSVWNKGYDATEACMRLYFYWGWEVVSEDAVGRA